MASALFSFVPSSNTKHPCTQQATAKPIIAGTYILFNAKDPNGASVGEMTITNWDKATFLIRGAGWIGLGKLTVNKGYYNWKFDDGKSGKTTFIVKPDGSLEGHVLGSGLDWNYLAKLSYSIK